MEALSLRSVLFEQGIIELYFNDDGAFWVKSGADKRKVTSPEELQRLFQSSRKIYADKILIEKSSTSDLNKEKFEEYFRTTFNQDFSEIKIP